MIKQFVIPNRPLVFATVADVPNTEFLFALNCDPDRKIFCHRKQGGYPSVTNGGLVVLDNLGTLETLRKGTEIVIVRESNNPAVPEYTRAWGWTLRADWVNVAWAVNAQKTYKAVASGHRTNGRFQGNTNQELELAMDTLLNITRAFPRHSGPDPLSSGYKTRAGGSTFSQGEVHWYRHDSDGTWTKVGDPRPIVG